MTEKIANTPTKLNAPWTKTNPDRVNLTLKEQRRKCTELEKKISKMQEQITLICVEVTTILKDNIHDLIENNLEVISAFMKLIWEEQKKYLSTQRLGNITQWLFDFVYHWEQDLHQPMTNWETQIFLYYVTEEHFAITKMLYGHVQGSTNQLLMKL